MNVCVRLIRCSQFVIAVFAGMHASGQNVQRFTLPEADSIFLGKNLYLIAANYNIDVQKSLEIQSRAYPNPQFSAEFNARDPQNDKWFHVGNAGDKSFAIDQVILLGGKRKNQEALAKQNTRQAELELEDLLRNLRLQLHSNFYEVYFDELTLKKYNSQLDILDSIIYNYEIQAKKGNLSLKEVVRLKSVYLQLNNDKTDLLQNIQEQEKNLQVLLQTKDYVSPLTDSTTLEKLVSVPSLDSLLTLAYANRADWKLAQLNAEISTLNLRYQKSVGVPDLIVGSSYDQRGGAFNNQLKMNVGIPLPLWNRNKGNIRAAEAAIKATAVNKDIQSNNISAEVNQAWFNMQHSMQEYQKSKQFYNADFGAVFNGIVENFRKRNISILEFVDFFESYNASLAEINRIRKQLLHSAEALNHTVSANVYQ